MYVSAALYQGASATGSQDKACQSAEQPKAGGYSVCSHAQKGAKYARAVADWSPFAVKAGRIITGQNPASSRLVAELTVEALSYGVRLTP